MDMYLTWGLLVKCMQGRYAQDDAAQLKMQMLEQQTISKMTDGGSWTKAFWVQNAKMMHLWPATPEVANTCRTDSVGTQISSMALHLRTWSGLSRSVSNMVRPTVTACPGLSLLGGHLLGLFHPLGTDQAPACYTH